MIALDLTTESIIVKMAGAKTTTEPDAVATYYEHPNTSRSNVDGMPGSTQSALNDTTEVTIVEAPSASMRRNLKTLIVHNRDTVAQTIIVEKAVGSARYRICRISVPVNDSLIIDDTVHLASNSIAHNLLSATHTDTTAASVVRGDIITGQAGPTWGRLALGAAGTIHRSDGTDLAYTTATYPNTATNQGLLRASSANVIGVLSPATGAVLTCDGIAPGNITWTQLPSNGQILIGGGADVVAANITGTSNQITVTNGPGSITLSTPQNIHTGATPTFASMALTGTASLTLGTASSLTGQILLKNSTNAFVLTLAPAAVTASFTATFPDASGARTVPYLERAAQVFTTTQCFSGTSGESLAQGANGNESSTKVGYDAAANAGFIQAVTWGTAWRQLRLAANDFLFYTGGSVAFAVDTNRNYGASNNAGGVNFGTNAAQVQSWPGSDVGTVAPTTSPADTVQGYAFNSAALNCNYFIRNEAGIAKQMTGLDAAVATTVTNDSATLATITGLSVPVVASGVYRIKGVLHVTLGATGEGAQVAIAGTATATDIVVDVLFETHDATPVNVAGRITAMAGTATSGATIGTPNMTILINGTITVANAGTILLQGAKAVDTGAANTSFLRGSALYLESVS